MDAARKQHLDLHRPRAGRARGTNGSSAAAVDRHGGDHPAGSFFTNNEYGIPILATIKALPRSSSTRRHRGAVVESEPRSKASLHPPISFMDLRHRGDTRRFAESRAFGDVDNECLGLRELPSEERHGLLFVTRTPRGRSTLTGCWFNEEFSTWGFEDLERLTADEYDTARNWKLVDTFGETTTSTRSTQHTANTFHGNVQCYDEDGHLHCVTPARGDRRNAPPAERSGTSPLPDCPFTALSERDPHAVRDRRLPCEGTAGPQRSRQAHQQGRLLHPPSQT